MIVKKENEITKLLPVERNNFIQEAVLYEAIGTHLGEFSIPAKNIVLEGDLDLLLLEFFIGLHTGEELKPNIKESYLWNGGGTSKITKFLDEKMLPHGSTWLLILDNDSAGQNTAKHFEEKVKKGGLNYKPSSAFYSDKPNFELEDILPAHYIHEAFIEGLATISVENDGSVDFNLKNQAVSKIIEGFKSRKNLPKDQASLFEAKFKDTLLSLISRKLEGIKESGDLVAQCEQFKRSFQEYYESISKIFLKPALQARALAS